MQSLLIGFYYQTFFFLPYSSQFPFVFDSYFPWWWNIFGSSLTVYECFDIAEDKKHTHSQVYAVELISKTSNSICIHQSDALKYHKLINFSGAPWNPVKFRRFSLNSFEKCAAALSTYIITHFAYYELWSIKRQTTRDRERKMEQTKTLSN